MSAWTQWLGEDCEPRIWTVRNGTDGRLLGIAPLARRGRRLPGGLKYRELILLGSEPAAADHLDCIVRRGEEEHVAARLRDCLDETRRECDFVNLEALVPDSSTLAPWLAAAPRWTRQARVPAPYVELPATWDAYLKGLKRNARAGINRCGRALAAQAEPAQVAYRRIEREEELDQGLDELFRLHQAVQVVKDHPGSFSNPLVAGFHRDVARRFLRRGWLYLTLLTVADRPIAAMYAFVYDGAYRAFSTGYDREWQNFGPGRQVMAQAIRDAIAQGARQFDLLRGGEPYKWLLTDRARELVFVQSAASPLGLLVVGAHAAASYSRPLVTRIQAKLRRTKKQETDDDGK
jgi:CelD/BcsL family acetyltransferase involved in cellulose biosynthesis